MLVILAVKQLSYEFVELSRGIFRMLLSVVLHDGMQFARSFADRRVVSYSVQQEHDSSRVLSSLFGL